MTRNDISDYVASTLLDPISRVPGVGDVQVFGTQYAMRIWLDPDKLDGVRLTPLDVSERDPGAERAGLGRPVRRRARGQGPAAQRDDHRADAAADAGAVRAASCCASTPTARRSGCATSRASSSTGESFEIESCYNGNPTSAIGIRLAAGANALDTADAVRARLAELAGDVPARPARRSIRSTRRRSCGSRSRRSSRRCSRRSCSCSS